MGISQAAIRYLLTIYELSDDGAAVRSVDISRRLEVTPASVVHMLGVLSAEGLGREAILRQGPADGAGHPGGQPPLYRLRPAEGLFYRISGGGQRDGPADAVNCLCCLSERSLAQIEGKVLEERGCTA